MELREGSACETVHLTGEPTNTFSDFIDATHYLVQHGYGAKDKVFAEGGSAGGLLMGAVANMAPQDYRAIIAHVPYVDAVTTMLDESIPLTSNEFDFEPAKWVARLRATKTDHHPLVFSVDMAAGHGGKSGRLQRRRDTAREYAFILGQLGASQ